MGLSWGVFLGMQSKLCDQQGNTALRYVWNLPFNIFPAYVTGEGTPKFAEDW